MSFFDYLAQHPAEASLFSEMMVSLHNQEPAAVAAAYDFSSFHRRADMAKDRKASIFVPVMDICDRMQASAPLGTPVKKSQGSTEILPLTPFALSRAGAFFHNVRSVEQNATGLGLSGQHGRKHVTCRSATVVDALEDSAGRLLIAEMVLPPCDVAHPGLTWSCWYSLGTRKKRDGIRITSQQGRFSA